MLLSYQKNSLLSLLAQFKAKLYECQNEIKNSYIIPSGIAPMNEKFYITFGIIDRNITSIEKQIKRL